MEAVTTAQSYTTITAPGTNDAERAATISGSPHVNFSGRTQKGVESNFSVGGWIRVVALPTGTGWSKIFWAEGQFGIAIDAKG